MHKLCNNLKEAEESGDLSIEHFREYQKAHEDGLKNLPPIETPVDNNEDLLLVKKFEDLSRSWRGPLEEMMEDPQRRQRLKDMFPSLEDRELRQLLSEAQQDRQVCDLGGMGTGASLQELTTSKLCRMRVFYN